MPKISESGREIQDRALALFRDKAALGYTYYGNLRQQINPNIMVDKLTESLIRRGYSKKLAARAVEELVGAASNLQQDLYKANQDVYSLLKYGAKIKDVSGISAKPVYFIDWEHSHNNEFAIAEDVTIHDKNERRCDLVIYVNGIAIAAIELQNSVVSVSSGIRQNIASQSEYFSKPFFTTIQLLMAGNESEGLRYGTTGTKEKDYLEWKNDVVNTTAQPQDNVSINILEKCESLPDKLDWQLFSMFHKRRFLDLIQNFVAFDKGVKKVCRPNQFFGIKKAQIKLGRNQGGILWHTQGSGKTLTMVWLSKWVLSGNPNIRLLIVTDRNELDEQIEKTYQGVDEQVYRAISCYDLVKRLDTTDKRLICSLIQKTDQHDGEVSDLDYDNYIEALRTSLSEGFLARGDFVVFIDECHRTQSGKLYKAIKAILPNARMVGFTGTPLLARDKTTSLEAFGNYIHAYQYDEAVQDGVVLGLRYETRDMDQMFIDQDRLAAYFAKKARLLNDAAKTKLKSRLNNLQTGNSVRMRQEVIVEDVIADFGIRQRLADGTGNAMLIADSLDSACLYYEIFQLRGFKQCALVTSFDPGDGNPRGETGEANAGKKHEIYKKMLNDQRAEDFAAEAKRKFIEEPAQMKLLIVVDKLLTGFDAPPCTGLYLDKPLQDHGLFQAICRVNRPDGEGKDFGYIVDYRQSFGKLADVFNKYTSGAFRDFAAEDVDGLIKNRLAEAKKYLDATLAELADLFAGVPAPRADMDYLHYFCGADGARGIDDVACSRNRARLYRQIDRLIRAYSEIRDDMDKAGYTAERQAELEKTVAFHAALKETIGKASGDFIGLQPYEADMRRLLETYIKTDDGRKIGASDTFTLSDFVLAQGGTLGGDGWEAAVEAIENNIREKIVGKILTNPKYYEKMATILDELIKARREGAIAGEAMLKKYGELARQIENPENDPRYPKTIRNSQALRAFFDNCGEDEAGAIALDKAVRANREADFRHNAVKERRIKGALARVLNSENEIERVYAIIVEQGEY